MSLRPSSRARLTDYIRTVAEQPSQSSGEPPTIAVDNPFENDEVVIYQKLVNFDLEDTTELLHHIFFCSIHV